MNVQLLRFDPPLEQAPDQIAERPPDAVSVTDDPTPNDAYSGDEQESCQVCHQ